MEDATDNCPAVPGTATFRAGRRGSWKYKVSLAVLEMADASAPPVSLHLYYGRNHVDRAGSLAPCTPSATVLHCKAL